MKAGPGSVRPHGTGQADALRHAAVERSLAGRDADSRLDELGRQGRGDGQRKGALRFGQIGADEDFEGAVGAGGAVPAFTCGFGAPAGGGEADGDAQPIGEGGAEPGKGRPEAAGDIVEPAFPVGMTVGAGRRDSGHGGIPEPLMTGIRVRQTVANGDSAARHRGITRA